MKKKRLIFILFLLPIVSALEQEELYSGTVYPGENVSIDNQTFVFNLGSITNMINIVTPAGGVIVKQGECEIVDFFNVCFDGTEFWYHNYTIDKEYFKAKVSVSEIIAKVELTRTVENDEFLIGEETKIDASFKNTGDRDATDVIYKEDFPPEFVIIGVTNCKTEDNGVRWYGTLTTNLEKSCSYKIRALNKTKFYSNGTIEYNNGRKIETISSDKIKIEIPDYQLNISTYLSDNLLDVGEKTNLTIIAKNINSEKDIKVESLKIIMPIGLKVPYVVEGMNQDFNKYTWKGTLTQEDKSVKFFFERILGEKPGNYNLIINAAFIINNVRKEIETLDKLRVGKIEEVEEIIEEQISDIDLESEIEENISIGEEEVVIETEKTDITTNIAAEEDLKKEEKEEIKLIKEESIIKKLTSNVFFLVIDAIIFSLIIIVVMKIIKEKRQNY